VDGGKFYQSEKWGETSTGRSAKEEMNHCPTRMEPRGKECSVSIKTRSDFDVLYELNSRLLANSKRHWFEGETTKQLPSLKPKRGQEKKREIKENLDGESICGKGKDFSKKGTQGGQFRKKQRNKAAFKKKTWSKAQTKKKRSRGARQKAVHHNQQNAHEKRGGIELKKGVERSRRDRKKNQGSTFP